MHTGATLTLSELDALINPVRKTKLFVMVRTSTGLERRPLVSKRFGSYKTQLGAHEGKVGTITRSRKGRSTRQPNGERYYVPNYDVDIVSYVR